MFCAFSYLPGCTGEFHVHDFNDSLASDASFAVEEQRLKRSFWCHQLVRLLDLRDTVFFLLAYFLALPFLVRLLRELACFCSVVAMPVSNDFFITRKDYVSLVVLVF